MPTLSAIDWAVIGIYLVAVFLIGLYSSGRQKSTRAYFIGDRGLPWWAVTLSIIATETSVATYIGTPGLAYRTDWYYLQIVLGLVLGRIFLACFFIPSFYRFEIITVYGFLEKRFGNASRALAALFFLGGRAIASGVRLFAACLAVRVATGLPQGWSLLILGVAGIAYTLFGGIKAVVWAECILGLTFLAGGAIAAASILHRIDGGWSAVASHPAFQEKLRILHWGLPAAGEASGTGGWLQLLASDQPLLVGLVGGFVLTLATHGIDQDIVQRMLACPDARRGGRSLLGSAAILLPMIALFLAVGSLLWFLHQIHPEMQPAGAANADDYFPLYIVRHMPAGIAGIVFAGLFATALSSHTSVLNALAATSIADFYRPFLVKGASEEHYLSMSRLLTVLWGALLMGIAWAFFDSQENILRLAMGVLTYFYGAILGVFLLGIFTRRGNTASVLAGMFISVPSVLLLQLRDFLGKPGSAPEILSHFIERLPTLWTRGVIDHVPPLAWPLWIVVGTAVSFGIGALGRPKRP